MPKVLRKGLVRRLDATPTPGPNRSRGVRDRVWRVGHWGERPWEFVWHDDGFGFDRGRAEGGRTRGELLRYGRCLRLGAQRGNSGPGFEGPPRRRVPRHEGGRGLLPWRRPNELRSGVLGLRPRSFAPTASDRSCRPVSIAQPSGGVDGRPRIIRGPGGAEGGTQDRPLRRLGP